VKPAIEEVFSSTEEPLVLEDDLSVEDQQGPKANIPR
jgi:hypothetical protein